MGSKKDSPVRDEINFGPEIAPGVRAAMRRQGDSGEMRPVRVTVARDGAPVPPGAELAQVDGPCVDGWHGITSLFGGDGPAQVATPAYRDGYDRIFGKKQNVGLA